MKNLVTPFAVLCMSLILSAIGCNPEDDPSAKVEVLNGTISTDDFEVDAGQIGIAISAREIAKKGQAPTTAVLTINASTPMPEETATLDEYNNLALFSFDPEEIGDALKNELKNGVPVTVTIKNASGDVLATQSFSKISFKPGPDEQEIDATNVDDLYAGISLRPNVKYYVQAADKGLDILGAPTSQGYPSTVDLDAPIYFKGINELDYNQDFPTTYTTFMFDEVPGEEDVFNISVHNGSDIHYLYIDLGSYPGRVNIQSKANLNKNGGNTNASVLTRYKFKIAKVEPGLYTITSLQTNKPLTVRTGNRLYSAGASEAPTYFRILSFDIDWDIQAIESKFMNPIMPPSNTNSAYNSTLQNCSSGSLTQNIGETKTITTTTELGWEESMSVSSTHSGEVSVTVGYEAETNFFGNKGKASASVTGKYSYSKEVTKTQTTSKNIALEKSIQVSVSREVGVPPHTAIAVADIYQQYENIKVPFVQRFRIFGKYHENNASLTGQEILTQFAFNRFTGVVTDVQGDFIEVTVRGTTVIDRLIETSTETRNIQNGCN